MFETQIIKNEIEIQGFNNIYYFEFGKDFSHPPEKHNFWEMVYVDSGRINAITNGIGLSLEQGQVIFHEPMENHAHISDKKVPNNMLVISFSSDSEAINFFKSKTFTLDDTGKTLLSLFLKEAKNALGKIPGDYNDKSSLCFTEDVFGSAQLLKGYFAEFLIRLIRSGNKLGKEVLASEKARNLANNSLCELIKEFMKSNICTSLTLKDVCSHFSLGKTQLCKIFKEFTGESPMDYFSSLKIKEAKRLIREKNNSITEISEILAYSSVHIFSRAFKNHVKMSPTEYQKSII